MAIPLTGDVLRVRTMSKEGFWHYGIYTEIGTVIDRIKGIGIRERSYESFAENEAVYIERHTNPEISREDVVENARSRIGDSGYNAVFKNCEHFVNWCRTNAIPVSKQVLKIAGGTLVAFLIICLLVSCARKK